MAETTRWTRAVRAVPLWLLREYLVELGGRAEGAATVVGAGWRASLRQLDDYQIGSLRVGEVEVAVEGDPPALERLAAALDRKLATRGGG